MSFVEGLCFQGLHPALSAPRSCSQSVAGRHGPWCTSGVMSSPTAHLNRHVDLALRQPPYRPLNARIACPCQLASRLRQTVRVNLRIEAVRSPGQAGLWISQMRANASSEPSRAKPARQPRATSASRPAFHAARGRGASQLPPRPAAASGSAKLVAFMRNGALDKVKDPAEARYAQLGCVRRALSREFPAACTDRMASRSLAAGSERQRQAGDLLGMLVDAARDG